MASIRRSGKKWRAQIQLKTLSGEVRESKLFDTKGTASDWATKRESEIKLAFNGKGKCLSDVFARYSSEVSVHKKGARWEHIRLKSFIRQIGHISLADLSSNDIAYWRDARLTKVSPSSVRREINLMSSALEVARKEWHWVAVNPVASVKKPKEHSPRDRRFSDEEIVSICKAMALGADSVSGRSSNVFLFAIETAMRCGEICALKTENVFGRVALIEDSKNGHSRTIPLSKRALEIWDSSGGHGFGVTPMQVSKAFERATKKAGVENATFHDSRREATIRLSKKLDVLELAKMTGHKDLNMLLTYYKADAERLADLLD